jgi:hypothetical protein
MQASYNALKSESDNEDFQVDGDVKAKWNGLLEKKWTSVIRLQKKVKMMFLSLLPRPQRGGRF